MLSSATRNRKEIANSAKLRPPPSAASAVATRTPEHENRAHDGDHEADVLTGEAAQGAGGSLPGRSRPGTTISTGRDTPVQTL